MVQKLFLYKNSLISYYRFGTGVKRVLCFHGYGDDGTIYSFLEKYAGNQFTFYSIDLPFHGKTEWNEGLIFTSSDLQQIIYEILKVETREATTNSHKLILLGFSLGGRIALNLYQSIPEQIEKIVLLAPDGLKINFWYWLSTQTWLGNKVFSFTMKYPGWFFGLLNLLNKLRLVNASIFKFVNYYIGTAEIRRLLFQRWTTLRKLKPDINGIKSLIRRNKTTVRLIYGKHDRIILPIVGEKFKIAIEKYCTIKIIHSGHQVLHEKHTGEIIPALLY